MRNKKLFDKTINILVNAYLKGTLIHSFSCACAVGNLVAAYNNYKVIKCGWENKEGEAVLATWCGRIIDGRKRIQELECTGYTVQEIVEIERAFERTFDDRSGYKGLMNVVDALIEIHQGTDDHKKEAKELFKISF